MVSTRDLNWEWDTPFNTDSMKHLFLLITVFLSVTILLMGCESEIPALEVSPFDPASDEALVIIDEVSYDPSRPPFNTPAVFVEYSLTKIAIENADRIYRVYVYRNGERISDRVLTSNPIVDRNIVSGRSYSYQVAVSGKDGGLSKFSEEVRVNVP